MARGLIVALVALSALPAWSQDDKRASREREALHRTQQALRAVQEQQGALQREKERLSGELTQAAAALAERGKLTDAAQAQLRTSRADTERLRADSARDRAEVSALRKSSAQDNQRLKGRIETAETRLAEARRELVDRTAANASVSALLESSVASLGKAEAANRQLYGIANELLDAYRNKGVGESMAQRDPFFGLKDVALENHAEEIRTRMGRSRIAGPGASSRP